MINSASYAVFVLAVLVICVTPGPDMLYILTRGVSQGTRSALLSALGMSVGMLIHTTAVVLGVAALLRSSAVAYDVLRYAGAAYLVYLAWQSMRRSALSELSDTTGPAPMGRVFRQAVVTNVLNPKIVLFYVAFLPQFVGAAASRPALRLLVLGLTFAVLGLVVDSLIALLTGRIGGFLQKRPGSEVWLNRLAGVVFLGLAARVMFS